MPPVSRSEGSRSLKNTDSSTVRQVPSADLTHGSVAVVQPVSVANLDTAAHTWNNRSRRTASSPSSVFHHRSRPLVQVHSSCFCDISLRSPAEFISSRPPDPRTRRTTTHPFRSAAGLRDGCSSNAAASGAGGTIASRGEANDNVSPPTVHTGITAVSRTRSRSLDSQRSSASIASSLPASRDGNASAAKARVATSRSEHVRATQTRKLVSTSAMWSAMSLCQGSSSIPLNPVREMFNSQSALTWRPKASVTSVGSVA